MCLLSLQTAVSAEYYAAHLGDTFFIFINRANKSHPFGWLLPCGLFVGEKYISFESYFIKRDANTNAHIEKPVSLLKILTMVFSFIHIS